jgi:hypothetical protein
MYQEKDRPQPPELSDEDIETWLDEEDEPFEDQAPEKPGSQTRKSSANTILARHES